MARDAANTKADARLATLAPGERARGELAREASDASTLPSATSGDYDADPMASRKGSTYAPTQTRAERAKRGRPIISLSISAEDLARLDALVDDARATDPRASRSTIVAEAIAALIRRRRTE